MLWKLWYVNNNTEILQTEHLPEEGCLYFIHEKKTINIELEHSSKIYGEFSI